MLLRATQRRRGNLVRRADEIALSPSATRRATLAVATLAPRNDSGFSIRTVAYAVVYNPDLSYSCHKALRFPLFVLATLNRDEP